MNAHETTTTGAIEMATGLAAHFRMLGRYNRLANERLYFTNRLSADSRNRMLLLESGGSDRNLWVRVPIGAHKLLNHLRLNQRFRTEPDANVNGRRIPIHIGSPDPFTPPLIRPNFLSEHLDLDTLVAGMRIARKRRPAPSRRDPAENAG